MSKNPLTLLRRHGAGVIIVSMVVVVAVSASVLLLRNQQAQPQDLGPQLEYIGRDDLGCFLWWCEVEPYSVYYFATNMNEGALKDYFARARFTEEPEGGGSWNTEYTSKGMEFKLNSQNDTFLIRYYDNTATVVRLYGLKDTGKPYVISITNSGYELARQAL